MNRKKKDIGEGGIDEEVHGFASADTHVLPQPWRRRQTPYDNNGGSAGWPDAPEPPKEKLKALSQKHHHHHGRKKDIGEGGIDEEVHGFASADTHVLPQPWRRRQTPYDNNGGSAGWPAAPEPPKEKLKALSQKHHHHHKKDIGEGGIDEEVHGFASADTHVLPQPWRRRQTPYEYNGGSAGWPAAPEPPKALTQKHHHHHGRKKDIGEGGIDEEVHGFASADSHVLPQPWRRSETPYAYNGGKAGWPEAAEPSKEKLKALPQMHHHHHHHHKSKDIGEGGIDEEVHGFASADTHVLPQPWRRSETPYAYNGGKAGWPSLSQTHHHHMNEDIANKEVRTDVFETVDRMIGQHPVWRIETAPDHKFEPSKSGQGIEIVSSGPSAIGAGAEAEAPAAKPAKGAKPKATKQKAAPAKKPAPGPPARGEAENK